MRYFSKSEFVMGKVNVFDKMDTIFLQLLDALREECDFPIKINSSYRSPAYNKSIGGASRSKHMEGIAVDIACTNSIKRAVLVKNALELGLSVGVGKSFVHCDNRKGQLMFTY
jgi:uncharacterized protein YcbK (DUF882 family)